MPEASVPGKGERMSPRPITRFEVDRHPTKIKEGELEQIRDMYQVLDYVEFQLLGPTNQPTQPPRQIAVYKVYFWKGLWLPLHLFFREALLNLDVSLSQLNPNAILLLVALWVLYHINGFPNLPFEEVRAQYAVNNLPNCEGSYYFQSFRGQVITGRDDSTKT